MLIYKIGEIVKVVSGAMFSTDQQLADQLGATRWYIRKPFDRTLEGQYAVIKNRESRVSSSGWDSSRYLIEFNDGEQYIISGAGLSGSGFSKEVILPDDLFEI